MVKKNIIIFLIFFCIAKYNFAYLSKVYTKEGKVYEKIEFGEINWTDGILWIIGRSSLPEVIKKPYKKRIQDSEIYVNSRAEARLVALNKAKEYGKRNLYNAVYNLRISGKKYIKTYLINTKNDFKERLDEFLDNIAPSKIFYKEDEISVKYEINLWGNNSLMEVFDYSDTNLIKFEVKSFPLYTNVSNVMVQEWTSLIIDAQELDLIQPALNFEIYDENNNLIYSSYFVNKFFAEKYGIVKYISGTKLMPYINFVDDRALIIRALKYPIKNNKPYKSGIIIANDIIKQIFLSSKTRKNLKKCRVIIITK